VVRVPGCRTKMFCVSCEVRTQFIYVMEKKVDRLCGLVDRVPGYRSEMYCASCEVRTKFICYVEESRPPLWSSGQSSWLQIQKSRVLFLALPDFLRSSLERLEGLGKFKNIIGTRSSYLPILLGVSFQFLDSYTQNLQYIRAK
jgi:hypothetical protein